MDGIDTLDEYKVKKTQLQTEIDKLNYKLKSLSTTEYKDEEKEKVYTLCEYTHKILSDENVDFKTKEKLANELFKEIIYNKKENVLYVTFNSQ